MERRGVQARRSAKAPRRRPPTVGARLVAAGSLLAVVVVAIAIITSTTGGSGSSSPRASSKTTGSAKPATTTSSNAPVKAVVPILTYYVINAPPPQSSAPADLYVAPDEFASQMQALKADGWHAVTLDQLGAAWTSGKSLGSGKPIVISFDNGYASQYANALPVLKRLGWVAVANVEVNGLPPTDGGMTDAQIQALIAAGWELDAEGLSHTDLTATAPAGLAQELATVRQALRGRFNVPVNWFCYPFGRYDANVIAAVRSAGFAGATTVAPGWASAQQDRYRLPRLEVAAGTSPSKLLAEIAAARQAPAPPAEYHGPGIA